MIMLSISETLKNIYRNDLFPFADSVTPKDLVIYFPALELTIETDQIVDDSFVLNESLCSEEELAFGSCEASKIKLTLADVEHNLKGQWFTIEQVIDGFDPVPLGVYKVDSCKEQDNLRFKDIIAYDKLKDTDIDVSNWYNSLFSTGNETYTLAQFRTSLLTYLGIEEDTSNLPLPNDSMVVTKTIEPTQISGRVVLKACEEINGCFGHIGRDGKFKHVILQPAYGLYPAETLYPAEDLYPVAENDTSVAHESIIDDTVSRYRSVIFEEYTVKEIDKLIIRSEEDDIGAITGTGSNAYVIQGNFLVFGKSASELEQIARNAFGNMAKRPYRPYEADSIGLPYVEVGDTLEFALDNPVTGYVLQRTLTGIQALQDKYIAEGNEEREQNFGINNEIIQLQGKVTRIKKDVEGVSVEVEDLANDTASKFTQTAELIELRVEKNGVISAINQSAEEIKISANKINLQGYVTITSLTTPGAVEIDGGNLKAGTVIADEVRADWVYAGAINASQIKAGTISGNRISGGTISGVTIVSSGTNGYLEIDGAYIRGRNNSGTITLDIHPSGIIVNAINCTTLNGYAPITKGNIGSQSVAYASSAGSASLASSAFELTSGTRRAYISVNDNFIPTSSIMYIGSSGNPWAGGYGVSGWTTTSDERLKTDIKELDDRYLKFAKKISPKIFKMMQGTSGRFHVGFIAQEIENAMTECGISDMEFAGLVKAPVYSEAILNDDGEVIGYNAESDIVDYTYHLRYEEFIPLLFALYLEMSNNNKK